MILAVLYNSFSSATRLFEPVHEGQKGKRWILTLLIVCGTGGDLSQLWLDQDLLEVVLAVVLPLARWVRLVRHQLDDDSELSIRQRLEMLEEFFQLEALPAVSLFHEFVQEDAVARGTQNRSSKSLSWVL